MTTTIPLIDKEFKAIIPPLSAEERTQLEQNILSKRKCHDAIILWQGLIIDGHHRYEICINHGIEFEVKELPLPSREAAKLWILDNQLSRRNLCEAARIEIVLRKEDILKSMAKQNLKNGGRPSKHMGEKGLAKVSKLDMLPFADATDTTDEFKPSAEAIHVRKVQAEEAGVSERTLHNYTQLKEEAHPHLLEKVQSGEVKIGTAHRMLASEIFKKLSHTDGMLKFISSAIPPQGLKAANPNLHAKMTNLAEDLRNLISALEERRQS